MAEELWQLTELLELKLMEPGGQRRISALELRTESLRIAPHSAARMTGSLWVMGILAGNINIKACVGGPSFVTGGDWKISKEKLRQLRSLLSEFSALDRASFQSLSADEQLIALATRKLPQSIIDARNCLGIRFLDDRNASREWNNESYGPVDFGKKEKPWHLFRVLVKAGADGIHRRDLEDEIVASLDKHKKTLMDVVEELKLDISLDRGIWKLVHLGQ